MAESFSCFAAGIASGTDKSILSVYNSLATPTRRASIYEVILGSVATPASQAAKWQAGRITARGTAGASYTPNNLDPAGPAGECGSDQGVFSVEPTYTANKELLHISLNQQATFRWVANQGKELRAAATQNNGIGLKSKSSTSTQANEAQIFFEE